MDYRALGELVFFGLLGLSILTAVTSLSFHFVLRPFLESILIGRKEQRQLGEAVTRRLESVEGRVVDLEGELDRLRLVQDFERQLGSGETPEARKGDPDAPPQP